MGRTTVEENVPWRIVNTRLIPEFMDEVEPCCCPAEGGVEGVEEPGSGIDS